MRRKYGIAYESLPVRPSEVTLRWVFVPASSPSSAPFTVYLLPDERIVSVETVPPNPAIGAGTRVWIAR